MMVLLVPDVTEFLGGYGPLGAPSPANNTSGSKLIVLFTLANYLSLQKWLQCRVCLCSMSVLP